MLQNASSTEQAFLSLLRQWGDALLRLQVDTPNAPETDGGILCPCCNRIHGRSHEAVYPLLTLAARTGREEYLAAAKKLFRWGENMICADGSLRNDATSDWRGVTVFGAIALHDALYHHGSLLPACEKAIWEARLSRMGAWLYEHLRLGSMQAYLNYYAANACAMALLGNYFDNAAYLRLARELASFCFSHVSDNALLYGEGHPLDARSEKGCLFIDAGGYNPEETLPALCRYADAAGDVPALERCRELWRAQLQWMLPDGAWDNSAGSRAFKWTYWGSRTTDGCQDALLRMGKTDAVFAEAAVRNFELYRRCTHNGLLYGGPDYFRHGEKPCVHHTFCHAKTLAASLNDGLYDFTRMPLPADDPAKLTEYTELDVFRLACGKWRATISGYDVSSVRGLHASGGTISLLWHQEAGALIACGAVDFVLKEPLNQQLPSKPETHRPFCPRIEAETEGKRFAQYYDYRANITAREHELGVSARAKAVLFSSAGEPMPGCGDCFIDYELTEEAMVIRGQIPPALAHTGRFILPLIGSAAQISVSQGMMRSDPQPIFNLNPGFMGMEYTILPDSGGRFSVRISV